ncbi:MULTISPECIES: SMI1/KNR4 family protein [Paenibacillus]|uniref:SMI1/KNR4 family protein n=1 Tax=Paenibacillus TaxID=44249 RepID=UPI0020252B30|nr:SMI1/KNR4 family protein [Paenibacillus polymyxa]URJ38345.1 SMI1/KNR4 family protein [Paenibacillus polymyxa]
MGYELKWSDNINLDESKLRGLEERWNIRFPKEYVEIVLNHDGSVPYIIDQNGEEITGVVKVPGKLTWSIQLLSLIEKEVLGEVISPIELAYDTLSEALPKNIFPFAINGSGDKFLFDFRKDKNEPQILFQNHEDLILESEITEEELEEKSLEDWQDETLDFVCESFAAFLKLISPRD